VQGSTAYADLENALPGGGDGRITIAVLDGPVDLAHPCFAGARLTELQTLAAGSVGGRWRTARMSPASSSASRAAPCGGSHRPAAG
jgi:hypothetical protein